MLNDSLAPALAHLNETAKSGDAMALHLLLTMHVKPSTRCKVNWPATGLDHERDPRCRPSPLAAADSLSRSPSDLKLPRHINKCDAGSLARVGLRDSSRRRPAPGDACPRFRPRYAPVASAGPRPANRLGLPKRFTGAPMEPASPESRRFAQFSAGGPESPGFEEDLRLYFQGWRKRRRRPMKAYGRRSRARPSVIP